MAGQSVARERTCGRVLGITINYQKQFEELADQDGRGGDRRVDVRAPGVLRHLCTIDEELEKVARANPRDGRLFFCFVRQPRSVPGPRPRTSGKVVVVNDAQKALFDRLLRIIAETPKSGALNAGKRPLYVTRFAQAIEARASDGTALVDYVRAKIHEPATTSYNALIAAGRPDLTVEAAAADADAEWASEFTDVDRTAARERLGMMIERHREEQEAAEVAAEAAAVEHDKKIVSDVDSSRTAKGKPPLTPEQKASMLERRAAARRA